MRTYSYVETHQFEVEPASTCNDPEGRLASFPLTITYEGFSIRVAPIRVGFHDNSIYWSYGVMIHSTHSAKGSPGT